MRKLYALLLFLSTVLGCRQQEEIKFPITKHLIAEKVPINAVMAPAFMAFEKDWLVVSKLKGDSVLYFYSRPDLKYLGSAGRMGDGPEEFRSFTQFCDNPFGKLIVSNLGSPLSIKEIEIDSLFRIEVKKEYRFKNYVLKNNMFLKNDLNLFLFNIDLLSIDRYSFINGEGECIGSVCMNEGRSHLIDSSDPEFGIPIYNDSLAIYLYCFKDQLDIYSLDDLTLKKRVSGSGKIHIDKDNWQETKRYYTTGYAGKKFFYVFNRSKGDLDNNFVIQSFTYDGEPVIQYTFNINPGTPFIVDEEYGYLYSFNYQYGEYLLRYKL